MTSRTITLAYQWPSHMQNEYYARGLIDELPEVEWLHEQGQEYQFHWQTTHQHTDAHRQQSQTLIVVEFSVSDELLTMFLIKFPREYNWE